MNSTKKEDNNKILGIFYLYIHKKIYERAAGNSMKVSELQMYLQEWRIPKNLRYLVIKDMEALGLLKLNGRRRVNINKPVFDEENLNQYYQEAGVF